MKLKKEQIRDILEASFPDYKGRKFRIRVEEKYFMSNYWSGGSRTYVKALGLKSGKLVAVEPDWKTTNPMRPEAHAEFFIPSNIILVEHTFFCGKDLGISIVVSPNAMDELRKSLPDSGIFTDYKVWIKKEKWTMKAVFYHEYEPNPKTK